MKSAIQLFSEIATPSRTRRCIITDTECKDPDCTRCNYPIIFADKARKCIEPEKKPKKKSEDQ